MSVESLSSFILLVGIAIGFLSVFILYLGVKVVKHYLLSRHKNNPVISPTDGGLWDDVGTFNPAASILKDGRVHLLYRAIGGDGVSRFGHAVSDDGEDFPERSPYPVFAMLNPRHESLKPLRFDPSIYPSGGSWGGGEDPRMVCIDGKVYVTFNCFDGWDYIRAAAVSIDEEDLLKNRWKWSRPIIMSPPMEIHKSWLLFPEKIGGKFAILHSINPDVQVELVDRLEDLHYGIKKIDSKFGGKSRDSWDTWIRGAGPPPIKTNKGWLVLYHAIEKQDPHRYKLGAMLLDINNPTKVLARSQRPILSPDEWYENDWKYGVVYACGAVVKGSDLLVYYGGGDKHVCAARANLRDLLNSLV